MLCTASTFAGPVVLWAVFRISLTHSLVLLFAANAVTAWVAHTQIGGYEPTSMVGKLYILQPFLISFAAVVLHTMEASARRGFISQVSGVRRR